MVVVAGNHKHRSRNLTNGTQGLGNLGTGLRRGIKEITRHQNKIQLLLLHQRHQALNHRNSNLFQAGAVIGINDPAIGLTDLPVRCVQKANQARNPKQR